MPETHKLTRTQRLERMVTNLQRQLGAAGIAPHTIEQVILSFSATHGKVHPPYATGQVISAPVIVRYARSRLGLRFKPTSVSAVLCKLTGLGLVKKDERRHNAFHTYTVR